MSSAPPVALFDGREPNAPTLPVLPNAAFSTRLVILRPALFAGRRTYVPVISTNVANQCIGSSLRSERQFQGDALSVSWLNGGKLIPQEKTKVNRQQNRQSRQIYRDKHNARQQ